LSFSREEGDREWKKAGAGGSTRRKTPGVKKAFAGGTEDLFRPRIGTLKTFPEGVS
jgi:hypothetical protein